MTRLLLVFTAGIVDSMAAVAWTGSVLAGLVVCAAGGWASAQHDSGYQHG